MQKNLRRVDRRHTAVVNPDGFSDAMIQLADILNEYCRKYPEAEAFLNITGGYKSLPPYLVILATALRDPKIFYLYENSTKLLWLPMMAISFDYLAWHENRSLLLPFVHRGWVDAAQLDTLRKSLRGSRVSDMIDSAGLTPFGKLERAA